jgi:hypothetical protein
MTHGAPRELGARRLNRATLARQLLLRREPLGVVEAVHRAVALQAQEPASPYLALWNRVDGFDPTELDRAFAERAIVKATLMRMTLHAVDATDYEAFHSAMQHTLRGSRLTDQRFRVAGLQPADADALIPALLEHAATPRTNTEMPAWAARQAGVEDGSPVWFALRTYAPLVHHPTGGPWSYGPRPAYRAAPARRPSPDSDTALEWLVRRYLEGFGPATVQDVAQFALVSVPRVRRAAAARGDTLVAYRGTERRELLDVVGGPLPDEETPAPPRLLAMWDSVLLAYRDRSRIIPPKWRSAVIRSNGDVLPTLLVDGAVAGVWRPVDGGIEATAFERLGDDAWEGLEAEARSLLALIGPRDPRVYSRYGRWWQRIEGAEVRLIGC